MLLWPLKAAIIVLLSITITGECGWVLGGGSAFFLLFLLEDEHEIGPRGILGGEGFFYIDLMLFLGHVHRSIACSRWARSALLLDAIDVRTWPILKLMYEGDR